VISLDLFTLTVPQRQVLKCSIAYLIASLFTFVPVFANLLSTSAQKDVHGRVIRKPAYSAHMVATIVCYVSRRALSSFSLSLVEELMVSGWHHAVPPGTLSRRDDPGLEVLLDPRLASRGLLQPVDLDAIRV
jgi:hypothetical protein